MSRETEDHIESPDTKLIDHKIRHMTLYIYLKSRMRCGMLERMREVRLIGEPNYEFKVKSLVVGNQR